MSCEHEVRFTIKPTDDACRFHFDVRAYKDRIVAPDEYSGATTVTPSDETQTLQTQDKLVRSDIVVNPAPTEQLTIDPLTQHGSFTPTAENVGFSQVTVEEDWDEILYPVTDETDQFYDLKVFNSKNISIKAGDRLIIEGLGRGVWSAFAGGTSAASRGDIKNRISITFLDNDVFTHARYEFVFPADVTYTLAGYEWSGGTGSHSSNSGYCFYGEYLKYKIIRAS